jgi:cytochrome c-type biogenesis protein CcmH
MTAAAVFAVLWPLARRAGASGGSELAVYRDQLAEVERDRDAGRIGAAEAEAARIEVSRRLLAARVPHRGAGAPPPGEAAVGLVRCRRSGGLYLTSARQSCRELLPAPATPLQGVGRARGAGRGASEEARRRSGWRSCAVYLRLGRVMRRQARRNALHSTARPRPQADLGEALAERR